ncbi:MAG: ABC transporter permease subunit [Lachnospiraceae bacterium]|nr:ABC transporter permease subunit [Lachnospiraceae bacterium]
MRMLRFEIKKVFSKSKNRVAIMVLSVILVAISIMTINRVEYVDENGNSSVGISATNNLRKTKNEWAGYLTEDTLRKVLEENRTINNSKEALSDDITEQNKAYAKKQGITSIVDVISQAFSGYRDYNYYAINNVSDDEVGTIYERRISTLKEWLDSGEETFTEKEKAFLIHQYEDLETPFYYEYMDGWSALLQNISTFILILALVIGFFVSGIFSDEFQTKSDSIFFSTSLGRTRGILSKIGAGFCITTAFYVIFVLLYTFIVLLVLGTDGANCPIQLDLWRSVYNITCLQAYLFILLGGYIGTIFASTCAMLVSAFTRSTPTAIIVPFIILCAFPFLSRIITLPGLCSFFPDQLLEIYIDIKEPALVTLGGKVISIAAFIVPVYAVICLILQPILYKVYKKTEIK